MELESLMLHTKFCQNQPTGFWKEDFESFLPYMGMAAILAMFINFLFLYLKAYILNLVKMSQWFLMKQVLIFICK